MKNKISIAAFALLLGCLQLHQPNILSAAAAVGRSHRKLSNQEILKLWTTRLTSMNPKATPIIMAIALDIKTELDTDFSNVEDIKYFIPARNSFGISEKQVELAAELFEEGHLPSEASMILVAAEYGLPILKFPKLSLEILAWTDRDHENPTNHPYQESYEELNDRVRKWLFFKP